MRSFSRELVTILLVGLVSTFEVISLMLRWIRISLGWAIWSVFGAFFGLGMIASVIMFLVFWWSHSRGATSSANFWFASRYLLGNVIVGFLFFGLSLGGVPDMLKAAREAIHRYRTHKQTP